MPDKSRERGVERRKGGCGGAGYASQRGARASEPPPRRESRFGGCDNFDSRALNSDGWIDLMNRWMYQTTRWLSGWIIQSESIQKCRFRTERMVDFDFLPPVRNIVGVCKMVTGKVRYEIMKIK